jgi:hypothetical protein
MNPFEFVIAILALVFLYKLVDARLRARDRQPSDDGHRVELQQRLEQVEERVRVLERIVTDERFDLKQQFKDLGSS